MRRWSGRWAGVAFASLVMLCLARPAQAYLDPGTGSFIIQVVLGMALACLFATKLFWREIKAFVARLFGRNRADAAARPPEEAEDPTDGPDGRTDG